MPCKDCFDNCHPLVTDRCVKYTGVDVVSLGVTKGMPLYDVEEIILNKLTAISSSTGIILPNIATTCSFIVDLLAGNTAKQPFTLPQFAELVFKAFCSLDTKILAVDARIPASFSFDTSCLTGDVSSRDKILQATISKACSAFTRVGAIESNYVRQTDLATQIALVLASTASTQFNSRMVPFSVIPYEGPISNFDNTGKGVLANGYDKIYLCNGLNGTKDWRGRSPIGANINVPGVSYDATVDPTLNPLYNYTNGQKVGKTADAITVAQLPSHTHTATDSGHTHPSGSVQGRSDNANDRNVMIPSGSSNTGVGSANISVSATGSDQAHNTVHPSIGCYYITYLP